MNFPPNFVLCISLLLKFSFFCIPMSVDAIMAIKLEYKVKKNWMGDPCFPADSVWDGVKCRSTSDSTFRIISM